MKALWGFKFIGVPVILLVILGVLLCGLTFAAFYNLDVTKPVRGSVVTPPGGTPGNPLVANLYSDAACTTPALEMDFGNVLLGSAPVTKYFYFKAGEVNADTIAGVVTNSNPEVAVLTWAKGGDDGSGNTNTVAVTLTPVATGTMVASNIRVTGNGGS